MTRSFAVPERRPTPPSPAAAQRARRRRRGDHGGGAPRGRRYLVGYLMAGDKLPKNAQISGIAVGGLSRTAAIDKLSTELGRRAAEPIDVTVDGQATEVQPAAAGLTVDYEASVAGRRGWPELRSPADLPGAGRRRRRPRRSWSWIRPSSTPRCRGWPPPSTSPPADAALAYAGTDVKQTPAQAGITVQQADGGHGHRGELPRLLGGGAAARRRGAARDHRRGGRSGRRQLRQAGRVGAGQGEGGRGRHLPGQPGHDRRGPDLRAGERHAGRRTSTPRSCGRVPTPRSRRSS